MTDIEQVYKEHSVSVYRFLLAKTGSAQLAEELTQETFYRAVKSADRFDGSCRVTTWLMGIAKNVLRGDIRRSKKAPTSLEAVEAEPASPSSAEDDVLAMMGRDAIIAAIHGIADPGREVLYLRLLGSLSFAEIGSVLSKTENWARVTYYRAKQQLIKELKLK